MPLQDASECLDEESIAGFVAGELSAADQASVEAHLVNCVSCAEVVADAACGLFEASGEIAARAIESTTAEHAADERSTLALAPGDVVSGKYRIDAALGRGGMGEVFSAVHLQLGHRVALKVLRCPDANTSARFLREAQICARLRNDHIVQVFDIGHLPDGAPYIVMEYLVGEDLARAIARGPLETSQAAEYLLQAGAALRAAHAAGVVHRDLKPANLFLVSRHEAPPLLKVLDFGVSKVLGNAATDGLETVPGTLIGSPLYMSPEQLNTPDAVDARTDIWSLGVILYEAVTAQPPFRAATLMAIAAAVARDTPVPPAARRPGVPRELEAIILRCLEKNPSARFQSVGELMERLMAWKTCAVSARPSASEWQLIEVTHDYLFATRGDVFVAIWKHETTVAGARRADYEMRRFARNRPRGVAGLNVVEQDASLPSSEAREIIAGMWSHVAPFTACGAVVFEGAGFRAAALRSVVTGLRLATRSPFPYRACTLKEAAQMIAEELPKRTGQPFDANEFISAVAELRAKARATAT